MRLPTNYNCIATDCTNRTVLSIKSEEVILFLLKWSNTYATTYIASFLLAVQDNSYYSTNVRIGTTISFFLSFLERQSSNLCTYSIVVGQQFVSSVNRRRPRKPSKLTIVEVQRMWGGECETFYLPLDGSLTLNFSWHYTTVSLEWMNEGNRLSFSMTFAFCIASPYRK